MRVLLTGAHGFVGIHLARELREHGHEVIESDRVDCDLAIPYRAEMLIKRSKPSYVVHLAARYGRLLCRDEPHRAVSDNAAATTELAAACAERDIPVLYASSSEVYGDHGTDTITEESDLRTPTTIYGLSKRWGEEALSLYLPPEKLCIARCNMLYGPEQLGGYGRCSLATFIKNGVEGKPFTVHQGTTRSWLYISDAVEALRLLIEGDHRGVFNLGHSRDIKMMEEVAGYVCVAIPDCRVEITDPPPGQICHKNYSTQKLESVIDWRPQTSLPEGIRRTAEWARNEVQVAA